MGAEKHLTLVAKSRDYRIGDTDYVVYYQVEVT